MKLPRGISDLSMLITRGNYYVDRTSYIEKLEETNLNYVVFLRPRRFGKSLFVSTLKYYYGEIYKDQFSELFDNTYIGKHPTPEANTYKILSFNFSRISTSSAEATYEGFLREVKLSARRFIKKYGNISQDLEQEILTQKTPEGIMSELFEAFEDESIFVLIDEYDHFANEILAFKFDQFVQHVGHDGFVRKFYEALKAATDNNTVQRMFITGVTPITLDSLTSGFNVATNITTFPAFNTMLGFTEAETQSLFQNLRVQSSNNSLAPSVHADGTFDLEHLMEDMRNWFNGYRFNEKQTERVYNPDMVLNFAYIFSMEGEYPKSMIPTSIASDYSKIRNLFHIKNPEQNYDILNHLIETGTITSDLTRQYNFEQGFGRQDFISLLFYLGYISIEGFDKGKLIFSVPNYAIRRLYWDYFIALIEQRTQQSFETEQVSEILSGLAYNNQVTPFFELTASALTALSNRDAVGFDEKYVKALFVGFANLSNLYFIKSEPEVEGHYPDVMLLFRNPFRPNFQFIFELKYLKKSDAKKLKAKVKEAKKQLKGYLEFEEIRNLESLKAWVVVYVGNKLAAHEEVGVS